MSRAQYLGAACYEAAHRARIRIASLSEAFGARCIRTIRNSVYVAAMAEGGHGRTPERFDIEDCMAQVRTRTLAGESSQKVLR